MNARRLYEIKRLTELTAMRGTLPRVMDAAQVKDASAIDQAIVWHQEDRRKGGQVYGSPFT